MNKVPNISNVLETLKHTQNMPEASPKPTQRMPNPFPKHAQRAPNRFVSQATVLKHVTWYEKLKGAALLADPLKVYEIIDWFPPFVLWLQKNMNSITRAVTS